MPQSTDDFSTFLSIDVVSRFAAETDRLHNPGMPGQLAPASGHRVDTALTVAQQEVLLGWLETADEDPDEQALAMLRRQLAGIIAVADLTGLQRAAQQISAEATGR